MSSSATLANASSSPVPTSGPASPILQIALRDIAVLFRTPWIIISRSLAFIIQLFVFAFLISSLVVFPGFFEYYAVGSVIGTIASISFIIGYDIFEEAEEGVLDYLLTLAVSRASTALYPIAFMPSYVAAVAPFSPVSFAADSARSALTGLTLDLPSLLGLAAFVVIFLGLGSAFYFRKLEGGVYA